MMDQMTIKIVGSTILKMVEKGFLLMIGILMYSTLVDNQVWHGMVLEDL